MLESTRKRKVGHQTNEEDGTLTGHGRNRGDVHELPRVFPAIISRLLHNAVFLNLKDLGVELPPYIEEVVELDIDERQEDDDWELESILRKLAKAQPRFLFRLYAHKKLTRLDQSLF